MAFFKCFYEEPDYSNATVEEGYIVPETNAFTNIQFEGELPDVAIFYKIDPLESPKIGYTVWEKRSTGQQNYIQGNLIGLNIYDDGSTYPYYLSEFNSTSFVPSVAVYAGYPNSTPQTLSFKAYNQMGKTWNYIFIWKNEESS